MVVVSSAVLVKFIRVMSSQGRKRLYDVAFKLASVEDAEKMTNRSAAKAVIIFVATLE